MDCSLHLNLKLISSCAREASLIRFPVLPSEMMGENTERDGWMVVNVESVFVQTEWLTTVCLLHETSHPSPASLFLLRVHTKAKKKKSTMERTITGESVVFWQTKDVSSVIAPFAEWRWNVNWSHVINAEQEQDANANWRRIKQIENGLFKICSLLSPHEPELNCVWDEDCSRSVLLISYLHKHWLWNTSGSFSSSSLHRNAVDVTNPFDVNTNVWMDVLCLSEWADWYLHFVHYYL